MTKIFATTRQELFSGYYCKQTVLLTKDETREAHQKSLVCV